MTRHPTNEANIAINVNVIKLHELEHTINFINAELLSPGISDYKVLELISDFSIFPTIFVLRGPYFRLLR